MLSLCVSTVPSNIECLDGGGLADFWQVSGQPQGATEQFKGLVPLSDPLTLGIEPTAIWSQGRSCPLQVVKVFKYDVQ